MAANDHIKSMKNVTILEHPLLKHKISILRNKATGTNEFRAIVEEIAMLMGYEALRDLPTEDVEIETPIETCTAPMISGKKMAIIPILRAGLGMVSGMLALVPSAKVGHIGMYRDEETHEPHEYYCKLPENVGDRRRRGSDAGHRRLRCGCCQPDQEKGRSQYQIHGHYCSA